MLDITYGEATDPGKVRTNNEDSYISFVPKSRQIARSHGGEILLVNRDDAEGARATVRLPVAGLWPSQNGAGAQ